MSGMSGNEKTQSIWSIGTKETTRIPTFEGKKEKNRFGVCLADFLFWRHDFFLMDIFCVYIYMYIPCIQYPRNPVVIFSDDFRRNRVSNNLTYKNRIGGPWEVP